MATPAATFEGTLDQWNERIKVDGGLHSDLLEQNLLSEFSVDHSFNDMEEPPVGPIPAHLSPEET